MVDIHYGQIGGNVMNKWNLNIELKKKDVENLKKYLNIDIPENFLKFLIKANASFPAYDTLKIKNEVYVVNNILDFRVDGENDNFYKIYEQIKDEVKNLIPFARDGIGNYFLIDLNSLNVYFYDHENGEVKKLLYFDNFLENLKEFDE